MSNDIPNITAAVQEAAEFVQATWQQVVMGSQTIAGVKPIKANINLRRLYADNIVTDRQMAGMGSVSQRIIAVKKIAEQLENGTGPWDMKPMLLGGPKARVGKNGKYNIIPFRHGTGSSHAPDNNFKTMPQHVYKQARDLKASVKTANGMKWGGRLPAQGAPGKNPTSGYQHKNQKHEGMVRIEKTYRAATQSQYMTFRVVSERSAPGSWVHPGYEAHHITKNVASFCKPAVEALIGAAAEADVRQAVVSIGFK